MHIIIEAPDRCGKTSLVDNLQTYFSNQNNPHLVLKFSVIKNVSSIQHKNSYVNLTEQTLELMKHSQNLIMDRSFLGEIIYGELYRSNPLTESDLRSMITHYYEQSDKNRSIIDELKLIVLVDEPENLLSREDNNSLSSHSLEMIKKEVDLFTKLKDSSIFFSSKNFNKDNILFLSINNLSILDVFSKVIMFLEKDSQ